MKLKELLELTYSLSNAPEVPSTWPKERLIPILSMDLSIFINGILDKAKDNYLVTSKTVQIQGNKRDYKIPARAVTNSIHNIFIKHYDTNDAELSKLSYCALDTYYKNDSLSLNRRGRTSDYPEAFTFVGSQIRILPTPTSSYFMEIHYAQNPPFLVEESECRRIESINKINQPDDIKHNSYEITLTGNAPGDAFVGDDLDIIEKGSPNSSSPVTIKFLPEGNKIYVDSDKVDDGTGKPFFKVGDYVAEEGKSCFTGVSRQHSQLLAMRTAKKILSITSDEMKSRLIGEELGVDSQVVDQLTYKRVEDQSEIIVNSDSSDAETLGYYG